MQHDEQRQNGIRLPARKINGNVTCGGSLKPACVTSLRTVSLARYRPWISESFSQVKLGKISISFADDTQCTFKKVQHQLPVIWLPRRWLISESGPCSQQPSAVPVRNLQPAGRETRSEMAVEKS